MAYPSQKDSAEEMCESLKEKLITMTQQRPQRRLSRAQAALQAAGAGALETDYQAARRLKEQIIGVLEKLELSPSSEELLRSLESNIIALEDKCVQCDMKLRNISAVKPELRIGVNQLKTEAAEYRNTLRRYQARHVEVAKVREWEEALRQRRQHGSADPVNSLLHIDTMYEEKNTIHRSRQMAAEIEEFGRNILGNLSSQRELLERARDKLLGIADTLGLTDRLMRMIQRRDLVDKIIIWGGMIVVTAVMLLTWYYVRK